MSEKKNNKTTQTTPAPQQNQATAPEPVPTGIAIETLRQMFPGMSDEDIGNLIKNMGVQYRIEQCKRVAAQTTPAPAPAPQQETVDADFCEVQEPRSTSVQNYQGGNTMATNITIKDIRKNEVERDLAKAGLNVNDLIDLGARCRAAGLIGHSDGLEICRRADWYKNCDLRQQIALDQAARKAELEAKAAASKTKAPLTTGQKILIGVGIAAIVLIIGGTVWWLISKKKADAAFSEQFDSDTEDRCNRIFAKRGLAI